MSENEKSEAKNELQHTGYHQIGFAMTCRSWEEYVCMFALTEDDLSGSTLVDIAAGASSFTAAALEKGIESIAVDPLYSLDERSVLTHAQEELDQSGAKIAALQERMDWSYYGSYKRYQELRVRSLEKFSQSFCDPQQRNRYVSAELPTLPFKDGQFSLVLCSHFLFLYEQELDFDFHKRSVLELLRICCPGGQIRIYPLFNLNYQRYSKLDLLLSVLQDAGAAVAFEQTRLPFIPGSKELLCITKVAGK